MMAAGITRATPGLPGGDWLRATQGLMSPRCSARRIIDSAGRSLAEPAGLFPSSLSRMVLLVSPVMRCRRTRGVLPMQSAMVGKLVFIIHPSAGANRAAAPVVLFDL